MLAKFALISALATSALAQSSYMTGLVTALRDNGLTAAADLLTSLDNSTLSAIESAISSGNHTGFAPDNNALANLPDNFAAQAQQVLSYHFLSGAITTNDTSPDKLTIARTTLTGAPTVNLRTLHLAFPSEAGLTHSLPQRATNLRQLCLVRHPMVISPLWTPPPARTSLRARPSNTRTWCSRSVLIRYSHSLLSSFEPF